MATVLPPTTCPRENAIIMGANRQGLGAEVSPAISYRRDLHAIALDVDKKEVRLVLSIGRLHFFAAK
jgi:hypothetical protein